MTHRFLDRSVKYGLRPPARGRPA